MRVLPFILRNLTLNVACCVVISTFRCFCKESFDTLDDKVSHQSKCDAYLKIHNELINLRTSKSASPHQKQDSSTPNTIGVQSQHRTGEVHTNKTSTTAPLSMLVASESQAAPPLAHSRNNDASSLGIHHGGALANISREGLYESPKEDTNTSHGDTSLRGPILAAVVPHDGGVSGALSQHIPWANASMDLSPTSLEKASVDLSPTSLEHKDSSVIGIGSVVPLPSGHESPAAIDSLQPGANPNHADVVSLEKLRAIQKLESSLSGATEADLLKTVETFLQFERQLNANKTKGYIEGNVSETFSTQSNSLNRVNATPLVNSDSITTIPLSSNLVGRSSADEHIQRNDNQPEAHNLGYAVAAHRLTSSPMASGNFPTSLADPSTDSTYSDLVEAANGRSDVPKVPSLSNSLETAHRRMVSNPESLDLFTSELDLLNRMGRRHSSHSMSVEKLGGESRAAPGSTSWDESLQDPSTTHVDGVGTFHNESLLSNSVCGSLGVKSIRKQSSTSVDMMHENEFGSSLQDASMAPGFPGENLQNEGLLLNNVCDTSDVKSPFPFTRKLSINRQVSDASSISTQSCVTASTQNNHQRESVRLGQAATLQNNVAALSGNRNVTASSEATESGFLENPLGLRARDNPSILLRQASLENSLGLRARDNPSILLRQASSIDSLANVGDELIDLRRNSLSLSKLEDRETDFKSSHGAGLADSAGGVMAPSLLRNRSSADSTMTREEFLRQNSLSFSKNSESQPNSVSSLQCDSLLLNTASHEDIQSPFIAPETT